MKNKISKIIEYVQHPEYIITALGSKGLLPCVSDEKYLEILFKRTLGYELNLTNPRTFNEKIQWLKLYNRNPLYTELVDKYLVKDYISRVIGEEYIIPTIGVWTSATDIDFDALPKQFVLKCNHNSGLGMCICEDKEKLDIKKTRRLLDKGLRQNYYLTGREWPYKNVERRIIAEQFIGENLTDYKLMCFGGKVLCSYTCTEKYKDQVRVTYFDRDWNRLPFRERHHLASDKTIPKPKNYEKMIELAEVLAKGMPFVRIDFYNVNGRIYFGEMTFYSGSGFDEYTPMEGEYRLGEWLDISSINIPTT